MRVLVACEFSGVVRDAFQRAGHDAWSCDILPGMGIFLENHYKMDVLKVLSNRKKYGYWDLIIAHPPCTYLCNSGVRWLYNANGGHNAARWGGMREGAAFFLSMYNARAPRVCVENPIMHSHARNIIGVAPTQYVQPWQFGYGETKRTGLWLRNLPKLQPTKIVDGRWPKVHHTSPGPNRGLLRSVTCPGIADAMADQWGNL